MNHRITHGLVAIVAGALVAAALAFSLVVTTLGRAGENKPARRAAVPEITHPLDESTAACTGCHVPLRDGVPASHATYGVRTCLTCHQVAAP
jgi:hypothetical protein